jgi:PAS domain S-box-containing protein
MSDRDLGETPGRDELFRLLVENVLDYAIFVVDSEGRIRTWSEGAERLLGYSESEILGESADVFFTPEDVRDGVPEREMRQALTTGRGEDDRWHVRKDGSRFWSSGVTSPLFDDGRTLRGFAKIMRDRTEWKRAEEARQESEARRAAVLETSLDGILTIDHEDRIIEFNPAAERIFGRRREDVLGRKLAEIVVPERLRRAHYEGMARYLATGEGPVLGKRLTLPALRADGTEFSVELAITRVPGEGPPLFTGYVRDITEREAQDRRRAAQLAVTEALAEAPSLGHAAPRILRAICENLGWDVGGFWVADPQERLVCLEMWRRPGGDAEEFERASREAVFAPGRGLPGRVWQTGEREWVADVCHDDNFARRDVAASAGLHGALAVPVLIGDEALGVMEFFSRSIREPDADLLGMLAALGGHVGQFIGRTASEEALRDSEGQFRTAFELAAVGNVQVDAATGRVLQANRKYCGIVGYAPEELLQLTVRDLTHPDDRETDGEAVGKLLRGEIDTYSTEKRLVRKDGQPVWVSVSASLIRAADGTPLRTIAVVQDLTERRKAEEALRQQQRLLQTITDNATTAVVMMDGDGRVTFMNPAAEETTGYRFEEARGEILHELVHHTRPDGRRFPMEECSIGRTVFGRGRLRNHEDVFVRRDGTHFPVRCSATPIHEGEALVGIVLEVVDTTEARRAHLALRESEERFQAISDYSVAGIAEVDLTGRLLFVNDRYCEMLGRPREVLLGGMRMQDVTHPDDLPRNLPLFKRLAGEGNPFVVEKRYVRTDGAVVWVNNSVSGVRGPEGRLKSVVAVSVDVTDRKRAEEELRESESSYRTLFESIDEGFCTVEVLFDAAGRAEDYRFLTVNPAFERQTGMSDAAGKRMKELAPDHERHWFETYGRIALTGEQVRFVNEAKALGGRWFDVNAFRVGPPEDRRVAILFSDITDRKLAEEALVEASRRKDEFLAMLAHELRNPLAPIRSGLDLLLMSGVEGDVVEAMQQQVVHLVRLVDDLLDVSRIVRGRVELKTEPVDLAAVVRRAVEAIRPRIEDRDQRLAVTLPSEPVRLLADPVRLTQVVSNLLHNASKYNEEGGEITATARAEGGEAVVTVSDNGIGIEPDLLPKVFDLFTQADQAIDRSQGGLGIGLTVVKSLVEMHGGSVSVRSEGPGKGSEFTIRLPLLDRAAEVAEPVGTVIPQTPDYRILLVDDNVAAAKMLARLLERLGEHEVVTAHDGRAALQAAERHRPDIILLDIGLPGMDGYEVARRLRDRPEFERTLVVALTGYGTEEDRRKSLHAGFDDHIVKPLAVDALMYVLTHPKLPSR